MTDRAIRYTDEAAAAVALCSALILVSRCSGCRERCHHFAAGVNRYALALPRRCRGIDTRLAVTTSRCVSCGAKIAPVTVLVRAASAPLLLAKHSSVIADPVQVRVARRTESRAQGPPLDGSVRVRSCVQHGADGRNLSGLLARSQTPFRPAAVSVISRRRA